jgi:hypothetical protein
MSTATTSVQTPDQPTTSKLVKATLVAAVAAGVILVTTVLPAEYGIDPTGVGKRLGLGVLSADHEGEAEAPAAAATSQPAESAAEIAAEDVAAAVPAASATVDNTEIAAKAAAAFGAHAGQSFDIAAVTLRATPYRNDQLSLTLEPGKGAEVKAMLKTGDDIVFHWKASGDVALDMHGERAGAKGAWTSYAVESAQREASGTFTAPFDGSHGWYWLNRGKQAVTVDIRVSGYQEKLYRP